MTDEMRDPERLSVRGADAFERKLLLAGKRDAVPSRSRRFLFGVLGVAPLLPPPDLSLGSKLAASLGGGKGLLAALGVGVGVFSLWAVAPSRSVSDAALNPSTQQAVVVQRVQATAPGEGSTQGEGTALGDPAPQAVGRAVIPEGAAEPEAAAPGLAAPGLADPGLANPAAKVAADPPLRAQASSVRSSAPRSPAALSGAAQSGTSQSGASQSGASQVGPAKDALAQELEQLEGARNALRRAQPEQTLRMLDAYSQRFPRGSLRTEASVLRIEALVAKGERNLAARKAKAFLAHSPNGPYARRVRSLLSEVQSSE